MPEESTMRFEALNQSPMVRAVCLQQKVLDTGCSPGEITETASFFEEPQKFGPVVKLTQCACKQPSDSNPPSARDFTASRHPSNPKARSRIRRARIEPTTMSFARPINFVELNKCLAKAAYLPPSTLKRVVIRLY